MREILIQHVIVDKGDVIVRRPITALSIGKVFEIARIKVTQGLNSPENLGGLISMVNESLTYMKNTYKKREKKDEKLG